MDEKQIEQILKPFADAQFAKARIFCRNFLGDDSAENVSNFLQKTGAIAFALGGFQRGEEFFAFQSQICRDIALAEKNFFKELNAND